MAPAWVCHSLIGQTYGLFVTIPNNFVSFLIHGPFFWGLIRGQLVKKSPENCVYLYYAHEQTGRN